MRVVIEYTKHCTSSSTLGAAHLVLSDYVVNPYMASSTRLGLFAQCVRQRLYVGLLCTGHSLALIFCKTLGSLTTGFLQLLLQSMLRDIQIKSTILLHSPMKTQHLEIDMSFILPLIPSHRTAFNISIFVTFHFCGAALRVFVLAKTV